jgi:F-box/leucine-rich repeat protein 10/11
MRRISSFKEQYRRASARAATPPPPVYEPLSPTLPPAELSSAHPAGRANIPTASLAAGAHRHGALTHTPTLGQSTRAPGKLASPAVTYEPPSRSVPPPAAAAPPPPPPPYSLAQASPIEALADVAVTSQRTSPAFVELSRHSSYPATSPTTLPYPIAERAPAHAFPRDHAYPFNERPTKRARSEVYGSPHYGQPQSRPATSHIPGWSYNVEQMADSGSRMYQPPGEPNDRLSDAQLLLDFFNVSTQTAQSPPSTAKRWSISHTGSVEQTPAQTQQPGEPPSPFIAPPPPSIDHYHQHTQPAVDMKHPLGLSADAARTAPAAQIHTPPDEVSNAVAQHAMQSPVPVEEPKAKKQQGWPKGKARGGRNSTSATSSKRKRTPKPKGASSTGAAGAAEQLQSPSSLHAEQPAAVTVESSAPLAELAEPAHSSPTQARRHSFSTSTLPHPNEPPLSAYSRAKSLPLGSQPAASAPVDAPAQPANAPVEPELICAACKSSESMVKVGDGEQWIGCDGCKEWYHYPCAGFNSEREVREVNKFYCEPCRPKFGETTSRSTDAHWAYSSNMVQRFVNPSEPTPLLTTLV